MYSITHNDDARKGVFQKSFRGFEKSVGYAAGVVMSRGNPGDIGCEVVLSEKEREFKDMLDKKAIYVGDRWFAADSSEVERARYLVRYSVRLERNRRRREVRKAGKGPAKKRVRVSRIGQDLESQRANRMALERRKCLRRSTLARCPTASELRTAYAFRLESPENAIRLGGIMMDIECFVDNSIVRIDFDGKPLIVARSGGTKDWIRKNCPELLPKYSTLMGFKSKVKKLRQMLEISDPIPICAIIGSAFNPASRLMLHVQPRQQSGGTRCERFVWESSAICKDAYGYEYRPNANYLAPADTIGEIHWKRIAKARKSLSKLLRPSGDLITYDSDRRNRRLTVTNFFNFIENTMLSCERFYRNISLNDEGSFAIQTYVGTWNGGKVERIKGENCGRKGGVNWDEVERRREVRKAVERIMKERRRKDLGWFGRRMEDVDEFYKGCMIYRMRR